MLLLTLIEAYVELFRPRWDYPGIGDNAVYGLVIELVTLTTLIGILALIAVRQLAMREPRSRFEGSRTWMAYYVEATILAIAVCIFAASSYDRMRAARALSPGFASVNSRFI